MWPVPLVFVPLRDSLLGERAVRGLEVGSVPKHVKSMLDAERATPGIVKIEDKVADLLGYGITKIAYVIHHRVYICWAIYGATLTLRGLGG